MVDLLKQQGYKIINFSLFQIDDKKGKYVEGNLDYTSSFGLFVFSNTVFVNVKNYFNGGLNVTPERFGNIVEREKNIRGDLLSIIKSKPSKPKFVYYHSMITHLPFYIDSFGMASMDIFSQNPEQEEIANWVTNKQGINSFGTLKSDSLWMGTYLNAIKYSNTMVLQLVRNIVEDNKNPSIIIVMSDHGFRLMAGRPSKDFEPERYNNFCAIYIPDRDYKALYGSITPINVNAYSP